MMFNRASRYRANGLSGLISQRARKLRSGVSLFELLLYLAILSIVVLIISGSIIAINKGRGTVESRSEVNASLRFAFEKINQDIRASTAVSTPASAGATSTTLTATVSSTAITYCVASNQLRRQAGGVCSASSEAVTADTVIISGSLFTRVENTNTVLSKTVVSIVAQLTASYNSTSPEWQYNETKTSTMSQWQQ